MFANESFPWRLGSAMMMGGKKKLVWIEYKLFQLVFELSLLILFCISLTVRPPEPCSEFMFRYKILWLIFFFFFSSLFNWMHMQLCILTHCTFHPTQSPTQSLAFCLFSWTTAFLSSLMKWFGRIIMSLYRPQYLLKQRFQADRKKNNSSYQIDSICRF